MIIDKDLIAEIKSKVDLISLVSEYTKLEKTSEDIWSGRCPHHDHNDSNPSFKVYQKKQAWYCMGCHIGKKNKKDNYGTDCIAFIRWIEKKSFVESVIYLCDKYGIELKEDKNSYLYDKNLKLANSYNYNLNKSVIKYLNSRGLDDKDIRNWNIGFDGNRITFPLIDHYSRVVGFSNRIFSGDESEAKYINSKSSEIFSKRNYLYGIHNIDREFDEIRVVEGALDVILSSKYGAKNILGTLGTSFTEEHLDLIVNLGKTPVFCFDGDTAGEKALNKSISICSSRGVYSKVLLLKDNKDMADLSLELKYGLEDYIYDNSVSHNQIILNNILNKYDSKMNEIKLKLLPELNELVNSIKNENELVIIKNEINNRINIKL